MVKFNHKNRDASQFIRNIRLAISIIVGLIVIKIFRYFIDYPDFHGYTIPLIIYFSGGMIAGIIAGQRWIFSSISIILLDVTLPCVMALQLVIMMHISPITGFASFFREMPILILAPYISLIIGAYTGKLVKVKIDRVGNRQKT